ncbi:TetR/AcrR family transcriptional regulator [Undibacterium sp. Ji50W]|uniref:TetR/AcrR family transcriptional regulator n=1 Tax=Undibacterium sp. Ji50W TaxID=3413041 RepID=UPI003BEFDAAA
MTNLHSSLKTISTARTKLLDAAVQVIREKGYSSSTVDDMCSAAGVTKGAFFHYFKSKEELAVAAAEYWTERANTLFSTAPYHRHANARDRVLGYIDFRAQIIQGTIAEFTCLAGTMTQEIFQTNPAIRNACYASMADHAETLVSDIAEALAENQVNKRLTAKSLALHTQAVLQGAFVLAKAKDDPDIALDSIKHLRRYFEFLFKPQQLKENDDDK